MKLLKIFAVKTVFLGCFLPSLAFSQTPVAVAVADPASLPENNGFQRDGTVSGAVWQIQDGLTATTGCSIPTKLFPDQSTKKGGKDYDHAQFHDALMTSLGLTGDSDAVTTYYDGFVTRLFDTPSTDSIFGPVGDGALLGVVQPNTDPHAMLMWGAGTTTVKYDCNSMLKVSTSADANYSYLSLATLQASFNASKNGTATNSLVIVTGHAQSLFDLYRSSPDAEQGIFANMQALAWEEGPLGGTNMAPADRRLKYISTANIISYASTGQLDSSSSVAASLSASVSPISFFNAKGDLAAQLTQNFQQMNSTFHTFIYRANASTLPSIPTLVSDIQSVISLGQITPLLTSFSGSSLQISGNVHGWPSRLCNTGQWGGSVSDTSNFSFNSIELDAEKKMDSEGFPVCDITFSIKVLGTASPGSYDPGLTLTYKTDKAVSLNLPLASPSKVAVVTTPTFTFGPAQLLVNAPPSPLNPAAPITLLWKSNGALSVAVNFIPTNYSIAGNPSMNCVFPDLSTQALTVSLQKVYNDTTLATNILNPSLSLTNPDRLQTLALGIQLPNSTTYDVYAPANQLTNCNLKGTIQIALNDQNTNTNSTANFNISIAVPFPPLRKPMSIKAIACIPSLDSSSELSLSIGGGGEKCTVTGNDLDLASTVNLQSGGQIYSFPLTLGGDSGAASFTLAGPDVKKLTQGSVVQVVPTDNFGSVGASTVQFKVIN